MNSSPDPLSPAPRPSPGRRLRLGGLAACWLLALVGLDTLLPNPARQPAELEVVMDSNVASTAQAYFDTGKGYNPGETSTAPIAAGPTPQTLAFPLPPAPVVGIRFDPLMVPGTVHLHSAVIRRGDNHEEVQGFDLRLVTGVNEIARVTPSANGLEVVTTPDSTDSQVGLLVPDPIVIAPTSVSDQVIHWVGTDVSITMVTLLAAGLLWWTLPRLAPLVRPLTSPIVRLDRRFAAWAEVLSRPEVARLDRGMFWFYAGCALVFGAMALAELHGSSLDEFASQYPWSDVSIAPLAGHAEAIRSDEWALQTPAFLNQIYRQRSLSRITSSVGGNNAALLISLPCRDFTQWFRPGYWGFHVLPPAAAFAVYWQSKGFILLTGVFSLLLLLTRGHTGLSALGALWMFFSAHMQWSYSWTSLLPEMVGFFGWTICLTLYLCVGRQRYLLAAAAAGCAVSVLNFALCFYPPHQIPLVLFGVLVTAVWVRTHRADIFRRELAGRRLLALAGCWAVVLLVLAGFYLETRGAIAAAANTVYPGQRVVAGGGIALEEYLSHFLDFWKTEARLPPGQNNVCEGTGFLWLLPVTLVMLGRGRFINPAGGGAVLAVCWLTSTLIAAWTIFPIPPEIGHWLLFDHVPAARCVPALGLINVVGVIVYLSLEREPASFPAERPASFWRVAGGVAAFLGMTALLAMMNGVYRNFFSGSEIVLAGGYAAVLMVCVLERWIAVLAVALLVPLALANGLINPVDRGLDVITRSALFRAVHDDPRLQQGKWLVYSHDFTLTGFVVATGAEVFNSFKVLPNLDAMAAFDPDRRLMHSYNQSGHMIARPLPAGESYHFENPDVGMLVWSVSPLDPGLRKVGVRFLVFDEAPDAETVHGLRRIVPKVPGIWVYELP